MLGIKSGIKGAVKAFNKMFNVVGVGDMTKIFHNSKPFIVYQSNPIIFCAQCNIIS